MIHSKPYIWVLRAGLQTTSRWENPYQLVWFFLFQDCIFFPSGLNIAFTSSGAEFKKALGRLVQSAALSPIWDYLKVNKALSALPVARCAATFHISWRTGTSTVLGCLEKISSDESQECWEKNCRFFFFLSPKGKKQNVFYLLGWSSWLFLNISF